MDSREISRLFFLCSEAKQKIKMKRIYGLISSLEPFLHISEDLSIFYILVSCQNRDALTIIDFNVPKSRFKMSEKI